MIVAFNIQTCKSSNYEKCSDGYYLTDPLPSFSKFQWTQCITDTGYLFENAEGVKVCRSCSAIDINCLTCSRGNCQSCNNAYYLFDATNDLIYEASVLCNEAQTFKGFVD